MDQTTNEELVFAVPDMTCSHCETAVGTRIRAVAGVTEVIVSLDSKAVVVRGRGFDHHAVFAAVEEAGYEAVTGAV